MHKISWASFLEDNIVGEDIRSIRISRAIVDRNFEGAFFGFTRVEKKETHKGTNFRSKRTRMQ